MPEYGLSRRVARVAAGVAYLGAGISAAGIVALILFYVGFFTGSLALRRFGAVNDVLVTIQYVLLLPILLTFDRTLHPHARTRRSMATAIGVVGIVGIVVFQYLFLTGAMTFSEQVGFASMSILMAGVWIVATGLVAGQVDAWSASRTLIFSAGLYFGFPLWALRVARYLWEADRQPLVVAGESGGS